MVPMRAQPTSFVKGHGTCSPCHQPESLGMRKVLFVCTGNFYRSRYAEALFNHHAEASGLEWRAFSRGLAIHLAEGYLSPYTRIELEKRRIGLHHTGKTRVQIQEDDLKSSDLVILLDRNEHEPYMAELYPHWVDRVEYWGCEDIQFETPDKCMRMIEANVETLIKQLRDEQEA